MRSKMEVILLQIDSFFWLVSTARSCKLFKKKALPFSAN